MLTPPKAVPRDEREAQAMGEPYYTSFRAGREVGRREEFRRSVAELRRGREAYVEAGRREGFYQGSREGFYQGSRKRFRETLVKGVLLGAVLALLAVIAVAALLK